MNVLVSIALGLAMALDGGDVATASQASAGQVMPPAPTEFTCDGAPAQPLFATFYNLAKPPAVALVYGNEQAIAFSAPAASGARYTAAGVEFWEHQGVANITWSGRKLTCRPRQRAQEGSGRVSLAGSAWRLVAFQSMDDTRLQPEAGKQFTLAFDADGALRVQADCNRGRGKWASADNVSLTIGPAAMTRAMCQSALYDRFVRDLASMRSYVLKDGRLFISLPVDSGIYEFERQATP